MKKVLVTAGSTEVTIDRVRCISNIFGGRTGTDIAYYFANRDNGVCVKLLTSNPVLYEQLKNSGAGKRGLKNPLARFFRTFDELAAFMEEEVRSGEYDVIVHTAAVSDYKVGGVLIRKGDSLKTIDSSGKISGSHDRLYLELVSAPKLVDFVRQPWGFKGKLVKFKLQVGIADEELIEIARKSLLVSQADFIVANCLEWCRERAYIIGADGSCENVSRANLAGVLWERLQ